MKNYSMVLALALSFVLFPKYALADHLDPFVQITCSPKLNYYFVRTFHLWDTNIWYYSKKLKRNTFEKLGIFSLNDFVKSTHQCVLPGRQIERGTTPPGWSETQPKNVVQNIVIKTTHYIPPNRGKCYENNAEFEILVNGKKLYKFSAFGPDCKNVVHQIDFKYVLGLSIKDCVYPEGQPWGGGKPVTPHCTTIMTGHP